MLESENARATSEPGRCFWGFVTHPEDVQPGVGLGFSSRPAAGSGKMEEHAGVGRWFGICFSRWLHRWRGDPESRLGKLGKPHDAQYVTARLL